MLYCCNHYLQHHRRLSSAVPAAAGTSAPAAAAATQHPSCRYKFLNYSILKNKVSTINAIVSLLDCCRRVLVMNPRTGSTSGRLCPSHHGPKTQKVSSPDRQQTCWNRKPKLYSCCVYSYEARRDLYRLLCPSDRVRTQSIRLDHILCI